MQSRATASIYRASYADFGQAEKLKIRDSEIDGAVNLLLRTYK